jgi:hypothetical protein
MRRFNGYHIRGFSGFMIAAGLLCAMVIFTTEVSAQGPVISGKVISLRDSTPVPFASVVFMSVADTGSVIGTNTSSDGVFRITTPLSGLYVLKVSSVGYTIWIDTLSFSAGERRRFVVSLEPQPTQLGSFVVEANQVRVEQKGDTTEFNAYAYQTHIDATAEDLVKKMPGVSTDGTTIKVHGEEVKKVLVDGKSFFGDDPAATLRNLPAELIEKIQVFDGSGEQAQFTGFRDGDEEKTLNIVTRKGKNAGRFGKVYAGYGSDGRYSVGLTFNQFNESRRISVIAMSNNVNQQNFNAADIMSVMGNSGRTGRGGPGGGGAFLTGNQPGNTRTDAIGINYIDQFGKKLSVTASYFFNQTDNADRSYSTRNYFNEEGLYYQEENDGSSLNRNHRLNGRLEYTIDSSNSIIFTPRLTLQDYSSASAMTSFGQIAGTLLPVSSTDILSNGNNLGYTLNNDLLWRHRFSKKGRTLSVNFNSRINNRAGDGDYHAYSFYGDTDQVLTGLHQEYTTLSKGSTLGGNISYTEQLGAKAQLMITYRPSQTVTTSDKTSYNTDQAGENPVADTALTNRYQMTQETHRGGAVFRYNSGKLQMNAGVDAETTLLVGEQTFPRYDSLSQPFARILPNAMATIRFSKTRSLRIQYRTNSRIPSYTQLQEVPDVSNPLIIRTGNMGLEPSYEHSLNLRLSLNNPDKARNFFLFVTGSHTSNYIGNASLLLSRDTTLGGYLVNRGSQLITPVNLDRYSGMRTFGVLSLPVKPIKSNLNLNLGYQYSQTPAMINQVLNRADQNSLNGGFYLSSNISPNLDFTLSWNGSYNNVRNSVPSVRAGSYLSSSTSVKVHYLHRERLVLNSDLSRNTYTSLTGTDDQQFMLWNAYLGYKLLKDKSLELKAYVFDILKQNQSISRNITEIYTEDTRTEILQRYLMVSLTYTFRKFSSGATDRQKEGEDLLKRLPPPPPGGGPPPGSPPPGVPPPDGL